MSLRLKLSPALRDVRVRRFIADNAPPHGQPNVIFASSGAKARAVAAWEELRSGRYRAVTSPRESSLCWTAMAVVDYELCLEADLFFVGCAKSTFSLTLLGFGIYSTLAQV